MTKNSQWDHEVDVLVVGSGNGAMTGALAAHDMGAGSVLMIEKSDKFGGTSALSGGGVWVPCNRYAKAAGAQDSFEEALSYLRSSIPEEMVETSMLEAYLKAAPKMVDYLHDNTRLQYQSLAMYPDYFSDNPGAKSGHRSMEPPKIDITDLGEDTDKVLPGGVMYMIYKYAITQVEAHMLMSKLKGWKRLVFKLLLDYYTDIPWLLKRKGFSRKSAGGLAGIIRLRLSMKDRNLPLWLNTAMLELIEEDGRVVGVVAEREGKTLRIKANNSVLLAAGGFEHNQQMREQYLPKPTNTRWSAGCHTNTGDAIRAGQQLGAKTRLMDNAWWVTTKVIPDQKYPFLSIVNKSLPGTIVVNKNGKRFSNESQNYMSFMKETFARHTDEDPCIPCYMVFDARYKKSHDIFPMLMPESMLPKSYFEEGLISKGETIEALAEDMGVNVENFKDTVQRFNGFAKTGKDLDFQRGDAAYDRYYGDQSVKPNPCLGPIETGPFYAIRLDAGDFGTQGGLSINENAQVLREDGSAVEGLYAAGNCTAAVLPTYPGPGSTLGPAMTFAYLAAQHMTANKG